VVDVDDSAEAPQVQYNFVVDRTKAGLHGITEEEIARSARMFLGGESPTIVHQDTERSPLEVNLRLPRSMRSRPEDMGPIRVKAADGSMVPFNELGELKETTIDQTIYRKNMERLVFVTGEMAGRSPVYAIFDLQGSMKTNPYLKDYSEGREVEWKSLESSDLGHFMGRSCSYISYWCGPIFAIPLVIMVAIPLTLIGIMPGFALLNGLFAQTIGNYRDSIFFTATGMIGMIALAGIVVRNSIILIDFIHMRIRAGADLKDAIIDSGAVRFTPILLTAGAAIFGSWIITLDPVFSGLAWSFIFGVFASTVFSLLVVPMIYYLIYGKKPGEKAVDS
jgi:multidrug efflux pump subunit AcrB